ncbi:MAG: M14 family metallopeptidase [Saprospiraceae bacterium]|nr:M14 family metallopeptidase [Saprospiraceae bacterium]
MKKLSYLILFLFLCIQLNAQNQEFKTEFEKSDFKRTNTYQQTIEYCQKLADNSDIVHFTNFGKSGKGHDLPLLVVSRDKNFNIGNLHSNDKVVILIEANIHPGESCGNDAGLMLIRDIAITKKLYDLTENVNILFIPSFNVDGHLRFSPYNRINQNGPEEMGWRTNASNLNLNRDFIKADAIEMQHWLELFNTVNPDFFIDIHSTDGADYQYSLTYGLDVFGNMDEDLSKWQKDIYLPKITKQMEEKGHLIYPYVAFRNWFDPRTGLKAMLSSPMLSEGYTAQRNRVGLLIETHMLKDYKTRVSAAYEMSKITLQILNQKHKELIELNFKADEKVKSFEFRQKPFPLDFKLTENKTAVKFKGFKYTVEKSELTGGDWYNYSKDTATLIFDYYNEYVVSAYTNLPEAYIIPAEWADVISKVKLHGIQIENIYKDIDIKVNSYKFRNVKFDSNPYEGRMRVLDFDIDTITEIRHYSTGSAIVRMNQSSARLIAHILEPQAPSSLLKWGFFNSIFEQKEYAETYVMEKLMIEMTKENPELLKEFEKKKAEDPDFTKSIWGMTNWFYMKTKYWDNRKDVYPIGKIFDKMVLKQFPIK